MRKPKTLINAPLLVLDLILDSLDSILGLNLQRNRLSRQRFHENLHSTTESEDEMQGGLLLNIVIREGAAILKLLPGKNKSLLVRWDTT